MISGFLLDTNIPSELTRRRPELRVVRWLSTQAEFSLFLSAVTVGELRKGASLLSIGKQRLSLEAWLHSDLLPRFSDRILPVTHAVAYRWGILGAQRQIAGTPIGVMDGLIAATALEHNLAVVTRNVRDFQGLGLEIINPWDLPL